MGLSFFFTVGISEKKMKSRQKKERQQKRTLSTFLKSKWYIMLKVFLQFMNWTSQ